MTLSLKKDPIRYQCYLYLVKIALIVNRIFFKTLPRSVKTSFMTKGHGQGVPKCKNYWPQVSVHRIT